MKEGTASVHACRNLLRAAGFCPIPLFGKEPPAYGKNNKRKGLSGWQQLQEVTSEQIEMWTKTWPDARNTGILTRNTPTLDLDILNEEPVRAIEGHVRERYEERGPILVRIGSPPKRAILFRTIEPFAKILANVIAPNGNVEKIEFLGNGQQVVVAGIHPDTKRPYTWHGGEPGQIANEDLPYIREEEARQLVAEIVELLVREFNYTLAPKHPKKQREGNGAGQGADTSGTADWQCLLDNIHAGRALHDLLRDLAAKLIASGTSAGAAVNQLRALMESSAAPHDDRWQSRYDDIPRCVGTAQEKFAPAEPITIGPQPQSATPAFPLIPFNDVKLGTAPTDLIKGVIPRIGIAVVWGPPKCGKSFWTFDAMMHVARGMDYRGHRVQRGPIVYCAFEGQEGFKARIEAYRREHKLDPGTIVPFFLSVRPAQLVRDHKALIASIRAQIGAALPAAIVLDTLNRSLEGSESKDEDMKAYLDAADVIYETFNCVVIVVHHCGVNETRPRGHTSLTGTTVAQLAVKRGDGDDCVLTEVEYMKDGAAGVRFASRLKVVDVGTDDDGDPITSCVIEPIEADEASKPTKTKKETAWESSLLRRSLLTMLAGAGVDLKPYLDGPTVRAVDQELVRHEFYKSYAAEGDAKTKQATRQKAFKRAVTQAQAAKHIGVREVDQVTWLWPGQLPYGFLLSPRRPASSSTPHAYAGPDGPDQTPS